MTKLNWNRHTPGSPLNGDYWTNPRKGFDSNFYKKKTRKNTSKNQPNPHDNCEVQVILRESGPHYAQLKCAEHDVHIQWLSKTDYHKLTE